MKGAERLNVRKRFVQMDVYYRMEKCVEGGGCPVARVDVTKGHRRRAYRPGDVGRMLQDLLLSPRTEALTQPAMNSNVNPSTQNFRGCNEGRCGEACMWFS